MLSSAPVAADEEIVSQRLDKSAFLGLRTILLRLADVTERAGRTFSELNAETNAFQERTECISRKFQQLQEHFGASQASSVFDESTFAVAQLDKDIRDQDEYRDELWARQAGPALVQAKGGGGSLASVQTAKTPGVKQRNSPSNPHLAQFRKQLGYGSDAAGSGPTSLASESQAAGLPERASPNKAPGQQQTTAEVSGVQRKSFVGNVLQRSKTSWVAQHGPLLDAEAAAFKKGFSGSEAQSGPLTRAMANITNTNLRQSAASKVWSQGSGGEHDSPAHRRLQTVNIPFSQEQAIRASFDSEGNPRLMHQTINISRSQVFGPDFGTQGHHQHSANAPLRLGQFDVDPGPESPMSGFPDGETARARLHKTFNIATKVAQARGRNLTGTSISAMRESFVSQASSQGGAGANNGVGAGKDSYQMPTVSEGAPASQGKGPYGLNSLRASAEELQQAFLKLKPSSPSVPFPGPGNDAPGLEQPGTEPSRQFSREITLGRHPVSPYPALAAMQPQPGSPPTDIHPYPSASTSYPAAHTGPAPGPGYAPPPQMLNGQLSSQPPYPQDGSDPRHVPASPRGQHLYNNSQTLASSRAQQMYEGGQSPSHAPRPGPPGTPGTPTSHSYGQDPNRPSSATSSKQQFFSPMQPHLSPGRSPSKQTSPQDAQAGYAPPQQACFEPQGRSPSIRSEYQDPHSPMAPGMSPKYPMQSQPTGPHSSLHPNPTRAAGPPNSHSNPNQGGYPQPSPSPRHAGMQPGPPPQRQGPHSVHSQPGSARMQQMQQPMSPVSPGMHASMRQGAHPGQSAHYPQDPRQQGQAPRDPGMHPGQPARHAPSSGQWSASGQMYPGTPNSQPQARSQLSPASGQYPPGSYPHSQHGPPSQTMSYPGRHGGPHGSPYGRGPVPQQGPYGRPMASGQQMGPGPPHTSYQSASKKHGPPIMPGTEMPGPLRKARPVHSINQPLLHQRSMSGSHPVSPHAYPQGMHPQYPPGVQPQYPPGVSPPQHPSNMPPGMQGQAGHSGPTARAMAPAGSTQWQEPNTPPGPPGPQSGTSPFAQAGQQSPFAPLDWGNSVGPSSEYSNMDPSRRAPSQVYPSGQWPHPGRNPGSVAGSHAGSLLNQQRSMTADSGLSPRHPSQQAGPAGLMPHPGNGPSMPGNPPTAFAQGPGSVGGLRAPSSTGSLASMQSQQQQQRPQTAMSNASQRTNASGAAGRAGGTPAANFYLAAKALKSGQLSPRSPGSGAIQPPFPQPQNSRPGSAAGSQTSNNSHMGMMQMLELQSQQQQQSLTPRSQPSHTTPPRHPQSRPGSDRLSPRNLPAQPDTRRQVMASMDSTSTAAYSNLNGRHAGADQHAAGAYLRGPGSTHSSRPSSTARPASSQPNSPPNSQRNTPTVAAARNMANRAAGSAATSPAALAGAAASRGGPARVSPMVSPRLKAQDTPMGTLMQRARNVKHMDSSNDAWGDLGASQDTIASMG